MKRAFDGKDAFFLRDQLSFNMANRTEETRISTAYPGLILVYLWLKPQWLKESGHDPDCGDNDTR